MFLHHAADCATIVKRLLLSRLQSRNLSMYMILDINENNRKPSNDGLRLFHLFRTGSAPGGSFRFPIRWSPYPPAFLLVGSLKYDKIPGKEGGRADESDQTDADRPDADADGDFSCCGGWEPGLMDGRSGGCPAAEGYTLIGR